MLGRIESAVTDPVNPGGKFFEYLLTSVQEVGQARIFSSLHLIQQFLHAIATTCTG